MCFTQVALSTASRHKVEGVCVNSCKVGHSEGYACLEVVDTSCSIEPNLFHTTNSYAREIHAKILGSDLLGVVFVNGVACLLRHFGLCTSTHTVLPR